MSAEIEAMVRECVRVVRQHGETLKPGLSLAEVRAVESRYGFEFAEDHREFLRACLPIGNGWIEWRTDDAAVRDALDWPFEGTLFDVEHDVFWPASWGARPDAAPAREEITRRQVSSWPTLVPIHGHRYLPAAPVGPGAPVFSVYQTDVIIYGDNLLDYLHHEYDPRRARPRTPWNIDTLPPWSTFAFDGEVE